MEIPRHWRLQKKRYQMSAESCPECGSIIFATRSKCSNCTYISNAYRDTFDNYSSNQIINEKLIRDEIIAIK